MSNDARASDRLGTAQREDGRLRLRYERRLTHPATRVWRALTESDQLRHWFPCDIVGERRVGAPLELPFWPDHVETHELETPVVTGRLHVWDPPRVFEWSWDTDRLRYELTDDGDTTLLTLTVWVADPLAHGAQGSPDEATGTSRAMAGYHTCLDHLEVLLDGGPAAPLVDSDALAAAYRAIL